MPFRSNVERRAFYAKLNRFSTGAFSGGKKGCARLDEIEPIDRDFADFNIRENKNIADGVNRRLKEKSLMEFIKETDKDFNEGIPQLHGEKLRTDKTLKMKHTFFGADRPYDEFWFETEDNKLKEEKDNKFSDGVSMTAELDPVKYTTGVIIEEAIRNYDSNKLYYEKYGVSKEDLILIDLAKSSLMRQERSE